MSDQNLSSNNSNQILSAINSNQNLSTNNCNQTLNDVTTFNNGTSNLQESMNEHQSQLKLQEYEITNELEELRNRIRLEIVKREQSNLKHNIFYIPSEKNNQEIKLLKQKNHVVENSPLSFKNIYNDSEREKGDCKGMPIILKSLLKYKLNITEAIHKLTCVEDILKCKIKFRENLDTIAFDLKANHKGFNDNNMIFYRQQWRKIVTELNQLKNVQTSLDLQIKSEMLDTNISHDDYDYLKHTILLKTTQCKFLVKHINQIKEVFREEINVKNKFIHIMAQMLQLSNNVLSRNSLLTQQMSDSYCNMIHTAQGLGFTSS